MFESQVLYIHSRIIINYLPHRLAMMTHAYYNNWDDAVGSQVQQLPAWQTVPCKSVMWCRKLLESASIVGSESVTSRSLAWRCSPTEQQRSQAFRMTVRRQHQKNFLILSGAAWHGFILYSGWDLAKLWLENVWLPNANVCNSPGFNLSILRHWRIWGVADGAVSNKVHKNSLKSPLELVIISSALAETYTTATKWVIILQRAKSYMTKASSNLRISSYIRKTFLIDDFATAPCLNFLIYCHVLYEENLIFFFISVVCCSLVTFVHYVPPYYGSHCSLIHDPTVRGDGAHPERRRKARELDWTKCCPAWHTVTEGQTETEAILEA
jgi:hypothetical protein